MTFKKKQSGFTLVELAIASVILTIALTVTLWRDVQSEREDKANAAGDQAYTVSNGLQNYITANYSSLSSATPTIAGFSNAMQPTFAELKAAGYIDGGQTGTNGFGSSYLFYISRVPSTCSPPACDVSGLTVISSPVLIPGTTTPDTRMLGFAASRVDSDGGDAGISVTTTAINGAAGGWTLSNPVGLAGLLAVKSGYGSAGLTQFYRRDGSLPLTAALNGGGQDISNINNANVVTITFTGTEVQGAACSAYQVGRDISNNLLVCQGGVWTPSGGGTTSWKSPVANYASLPATGNTLGDVRLAEDTNRAYAWNGVAWAALAVDQNGNINIPGTATMSNADITGTATVGAACSPNGLVAQDGTGLLLSCQSGSWQKQSAGGLFKGLFDVAYTGSCEVGNPLTGSCSCPSGSTAYLADVHYLNGFWSSLPDYLYQCIG